MTRDAPSFDELAPGILFAERYELLRVLGQGGFAKVFLASDRMLDGTCAVKVLSPAVAHDEAHLKRFRREVTLARRISHKNVCKLYDVGQAGSLAFLTMECVDGQSLHEMLGSRQPLELRLGLEICLQIAQGLAAAHDEGVVHRDLKPHNVLLDRSGTVKLLDFGIARAMDTDGLTATGVTMGTPTYMSPEQCRGERGDLRSDLYSLGVVMYQLFTGHPPFSADTPLGLLFRHVDQVPQPPVEINAGLPPSVNQLVLRCLAKQPEQRFASAREVASAIEAALSELGHPPGTGTGGSPASTGTWAAAAAAKASPASEPGPAESAEPTAATLLAHPTAPSAQETTAGPAAPAGAKPGPGPRYAAAAAVAVGLVLAAVLALPRLMPGPPDPPGTGPVPALQEASPAADPPPPVLARPRPVLGSPEAPAVPPAAAGPGLPAIPEAPGLHPEPPAAPQTQAPEPSPVPPAAGRITLIGAPPDAQVCVGGAPWPHERADGSLALTGVEAGQRSVTLSSPSMGWISRDVAVPAGAASEATLRLLEEDWSPVLYRLTLQFGSSGGVELLERADEQAEIELPDGEMVQLEFDSRQMQLVVHRSDGRQQVQRCTQEGGSACAAPPPASCGRLAPAD
jgi:eukaryotic-like serine/threonine-protein kinase